MLHFGMPREGEFMSLTKPSEMKFGEIKKRTTNIWLIEHLAQQEKQFLSVFYWGALHCLFL